jgi:hypothetical protein
VRERPVYFPYPTPHTLFLAMPKVNLAPLDIALMIVYLVAVIAWGVRHSKRQGAEGYFLGGRSMT